MEHGMINTNLVISNEGQIPGLPANPRQWTRKELDRLKASIQETPELLEARGIIVYPFEGDFIVLGGNMRLAAAIELGLKEVPCIIIPEDTPTEKLKQIVIKDNGSFGAWDYDQLGNEWDDLPLVDWGVPAWNPIVPDEAAVDDLFTEGEKQKDILTHLDIELSHEHEDKAEDIRKAIEITLQEWAGCTVRIK